MRCSTGRAPAAYSTSPCGPATVTVDRLSEATIFAPGGHRRPPGSAPVDLDVPVRRPKERRGYDDYRARAVHNSDGLGDPGNGGGEADLRVPSQSAASLQKILTSG